LPQTHPDHIAGGRVIRTFTMGDKHLLARTVLTRDQILSMRTQNRNALIDKGHLVVWPREAVAAPAENLQRFVVPMAFGRGYDVIEGRKVNETPLTTREEANRLAGIAPPPDKKDQH
jgi:hypothetical protein